MWALHIQERVITATTQQRIREASDVLLNSRNQPRNPAPKSSGKREGPLPMIPPGHETLDPCFDPWESGKPSYAIIRLRAA